MPGPLLPAKYARPLSVKPSTVLNSTSCCGNLILALGTRLSFSGFTVVELITGYRQTMNKRDIQPHQK